MSWKEIREKHESSWWKIGRTKLEVMQGIPQEWQRADVSMDDIKARVLKIWEAGSDSEDDETVMKNGYGGRLL